MVVSADPVISVVIVDDHPLMCEGLCEALSSHDDIRVVAVAHTGAEALKAIADSKPDVVLLDYRLPDTDGVSLLREFKHRRFTARVVMLTCYSDEHCVRSAIDSGACGFLTKRNADGQVLLGAVRKAFANVSVVSSDALTALLTTVREEGDRCLDHLTERELQVWRLASEGKTNAELAAMLFVTERTVKFHISNILRKTGTRSRAEATALAYRTGIMDGSE